MKISMKIGKTVAECFEDFIFSKKAQGLVKKTIKSYRQQFNSLSRHLYVTMPIEALSKSDLDSQD